MYLSYSEGVQCTECLPYLISCAFEEIHLEEHCLLGLEHSSIFNDCSSMMYEFPLHASETPSVVSAAGSD